MHFSFSEQTLKVTEQWEHPLWCHFHFDKNFKVSDLLFFEAKKQFLWMNCGSFRLQTDLFGHKWMLFVKCTVPLRQTIIWPVESVFEGFRFIDVNSKAKGWLELQERMLLHFCIAHNVRWKCILHLEKTCWCYWCQQGRHFNSLTFC